MGGLPSRRYQNGVYKFAPYYLAENQRNKRLIGVGYNLFHP